MATKPLIWIAVSAFAAALAIAPGTRAEDGKSALEADPAGWHNLMPDASLTHWTRQPIPITGTLGRAQWHVDPATKYLICDGDSYGDYFVLKRPTASRC